MSVIYTIKADELVVTGVAQKDNILDFIVGALGAPGIISTKATTTDTSVALELNPHGNANVRLGGPLQVWGVPAPPPITAATVGTIVYDTGSGNFLFGNPGSWTILPTGISSDTGRIITHAMSPYTVLGTDFILSADSITGLISIVLPTAASVNRWQTFVVKDQGGIASTNNITISVTGGGTIDGNATYVMKDNYQSTTIYNNGTQWFNI